MYLPRLTVIVLVSLHIQVRVIDQPRYKSVYEDIMKKVDRWENDTLPQIKLDKTEVHII